ncbi:DUF4089 domain-containing protein [Oscillatoria sp. FACHB-1407]|uniref:DUF4089 domain-containing protein n=1 Tax=Oscillatoria sp. FACHB-1407 TaxID=2692847 RepID=UPI0016826C9C|nr:DUF4089 domain-containing protein [Oscillatoria sp. FACHB-1407]MBD2462480.1 DUF4089 domain-containing protein [Oscillatoria sp. FACHB-1407]
MTEKILNFESYVEQMALVLDLPIAPEYKPGVVDNVARTAAIAQLVLDFPLPDVEVAPTFRPDFEP